MSKLDGNVRWGGKMVTTEHQEAYDKRNEPKISGRVTTDELLLIREWMLLPHMLTMADRSMQDKEKRKDVLRPLYVQAAQLVMDAITHDLSAIKKELARRQIKVWTDTTEEAVVFCGYNCRGYQDRLGVTRDVLRAEISMRFSKYIRDVVSKKD